MSDNEQFNAMVRASIEAIEDFHDFDDDRAIVWASSEIDRLRKVLNRIANTKIPYSDGYTIATEMRKLSKNAIGEE